MKLYYPLIWPDHLPRSPKSETLSSDFYTSINVDNSIAEHQLNRWLGRVSGKDLIITSNKILKSDGELECSLKQRGIKDFGVSVYFTRHEKLYNMTADGYEKVDANIRAIAKLLNTILYIRTNSSKRLMEQVFSTFEISHLPPELQDINQERGGE